jgi:hypothetical protein
VVGLYKCHVDLVQVTFRDPESARKACEDPTPVIDGRRANCNLASLGRAQPAVPLGRPRSAGSYFGVPVPRGVYVGGYGQHRTLPLGYYQGFPVPQYRYDVLTFPMQLPALRWPICDNLQVVLT